MLRECPFSVSFWNRLGPPTGLYNSFGLPLSDWLHDNCSSTLPSRHHGIPWSTLFIFGIWSLWTNRNYATYQAKPLNQQLLKECVAKALEYHFLAALSKVPSARPRLNAKWNKPPPGWYKLNSDASITNGHAGVGGLLGDSNGTWVQGFSKPLGTAMVLMAELWALREGLRMARQLNIYYLMVNVDSSDVVKVYSSSSSSNRLTWPLVAECRDILQAFHQVQLSHCYREANHAADLVAKIGSSQREDFVYYVTPPFSLLDVLTFDCASDSAPKVSVNPETTVSFDTRSLAG